MEEAWDGFDGDMELKKDNHLRDKFAETYLYIAEG